VETTAEKSCRLIMTLCLTLLWVSNAHAQRIPIELVWSATTALVAPVIAVPIKIGLIRVSKIELSDFRPWSLSLVEWIIWFPIAFALVQLSDSNLIPVVIPALYALSTWLHKFWTNNASWQFAILLSLITPALALLFPLLAVLTIGFLQSLSA